MTKKVCAIDISEEHLTGIVLEQRKQEYTVLSCNRISRHPDRNDPGEQLEQLLSGMDIAGVSCICGLPFSCAVLFSFPLVVL